MELTHTPRCPPHLAPSLFAETRSRTGAPPMHERWPLARYDAPLHAEHYNMTTMGGMYHPVVRGLAPPGCKGAVIRVPVAMLMQWSQDVTCGVLVLSCSLGALLVGRRAFAGALLREHGFQLCTVAITGVMVLVIGTSVGVVGYLAS